MIKIAYITGTRADFGLMKNILKVINDTPEFKLSIFATGMHLLEEFGHTIDQVQQNFPQTKIIDVVPQGDNRVSMAHFTAECLTKISNEYSQNNPDFVLVLGDRGEQFASAVAAKYLNIPIIHIHGGESSGTIDNSIRFAISSLADYHFTATQNSAKKLKKINIPDNKIFVIGAPGLEEIVNLKKHKIKKQIVLLQHPAENENQAVKQINITLEAILSFNIPVFVIYPNADAGGRRMIKEIEKFIKNPLIKTYKSMPRIDFLRLLSESALLAGNSSSGIIEAASLKIPVIDIGERQKNREHGINVLHVAYNKEEIICAVKKALFDKNFKNQISVMKNPYGDGKTSELVIKLLKQFAKNE